MASIETLQQNHFFSITLSKYPSSLSTFKFHYSSNFHTFSPTKHNPISAKLQTNTTHLVPSRTENFKPVKESGSGLFSLEGKDETLFSSRENKAGKRDRNDKFVRKDMGYRKKREKGSESSSSLMIKENVEKKSKKNGGNLLGEKKGRKGSRKSSIDRSLPEVHLRVSLDMCSKKGDVMGAIELFDSALRDGIVMGQYHYAVLLYLCSSAAVGVVRPAKSGNGARTLNADVSDDGSGANKGNGCMELSFAARFDNLDSTKNDDDSVDVKDVSGSQEANEIWVSEDVKKYALERGFEIYEKMCLDNVPMNEATLTSIARMAMSMGNGDMAFEMVKQMKPLGINPRLRSYGPALSVYCNSGDIDKAFLVEGHMLDHGVYPEEPELEALLKVSVEAGKGDKVYYILHKLRASVRKVLPATADLIVKWFESTSATRVGKTKWDLKLMKEAIANGGGGWHGQGWLGRGKWTVSRTTVGTDGLCKCCGEKLATIDLDPTETENFAESVASIAIKREKNLSFQKFQKWLDYYGPFEAVVDAANVGLYSQNRFVPSKVNAVVNGMRQKLPTKKWPLIVLHHKRTNGQKMDEPVNRALIEKWKNADALYATPTGSNDDWYWLYAAIKCKCLLVTNDEMRDHTFQLLGNDFFPKWKERHQVHFSFSDGGPIFHMPPPCSVVIQESENGHWHVPIASEHEYEAKREWLCVTRAKSRVSHQDSPTRPEGKSRSATSRTEVKMNLQPSSSPWETYKNLRNILPESVFSNHLNVLAEIEVAEELGNCVIDFQI